MARIIALAALAALFTGCGVGVLQTARPVEKGVFEIHGGSGLLANDVVKERTGDDFSWSFVDLGGRLGITDNLDVGGKIQFFPGGVLDTRYNFLPKDNPLALSVRAGIGGAVGTQGGSIHVPVSLGISYDFPWVTPYGHVTWSHFWFVGYEPDGADTTDYVDAAGHGDGVLRSTAGLRLRVNKFLQFYAEYNYWLPVLNDEGDFYRFDNTHAALVGVGVLSGSPIF